MPLLVYMMCTHMNSRRGYRRYYVPGTVVRGENLRKLFGAKRHGRIARIEYIPVRLLPSRPLHGALPREYNVRLFCYEASYTSTWYIHTYKVS